MKKPNKATCRDLVYWEERLYAYAEGDAPPEMRAAVEEHVGICAYCKTQLEDIEFMIRVLRTDAPQVPAALHDDIMNAVIADADASPRTQPKEMPVHTKKIPGETPLVSMVRSRKAEERRQTGIRILGGIAAACILAVGVRQLLPLLPSAQRAGTDDASRVLSDLRDTGDGAFVDGVFVGSGTTVPAESAEEAADTEENVLGALLNIFSEKSEAVSVAESAAIPADRMTLTAPAKEKSRIAAVLSALQADGVLFFEPQDNGFTVTLRAADPSFPDVLKKEGIRVTVTETGETPTEIELILE